MFTIKREDGRKAAKSLGNIYFYSYVYCEVVHPQILVDSYSSGA